VAAGSAERARIAFVTQGCRVSQADADALAGALSAVWSVAGRGERADVVVVSTCAVTAGADAAARKAVRRAGKDHPGACIVVAGCSAALRPEALAPLPRVAAVLGVRPAPEAVLAAAGPRGASGTEPLGAAPARARPLLKVQDGCDAACSYCVVPAARGPSRSLPLEDALRRIALLAERHREVVLTGAHLGVYGRDLDPASSLAALVAAAARAHPALRLRLSSVEPLELARALPDDPAALRALAPHLHLPLQSGSDRVLAAMRRPYRAATYAAVVREAARRMPGACLGADVLSGFPGETDADHAATLALVEALPLAYLHVFPFSPRPGTAAAALGDPVPTAVARARAAELRALSARRWRGFLDGLVGRSVEVVVERVSGGRARGTAGEYATVSFPVGGARRGDLVRVEVVARDGARLAGVRRRA
jgi:threonylcarbamoyladenosine tRNA methylthiotransferase MtaB